MGRELAALAVARALLSPARMVAFAVGVWVGAALGACIMGSLWAQDRRTGSQPLLATRTVRRPLPARRMAASVH
jgi:hypothetical protein